MKCPHCRIEFFPGWNTVNLLQHKIGDLHSQTVVGTIQNARCPSCGKLTFELTVAHQETGEGIPIPRRVYPTRTLRDPAPPEVPAAIAQDYHEASAVLDASAKASAALSRRCLQAILWDNGYRAKDLSKEIDLLLNEPDTRRAIPQTLRVTIDGVRNFGNFSAHPINDVTSLQVIEVEEHEAEWCLDILDECFQHFYVRPAVAAARKAALDAKLAQAGKSPSK